MFRYRGNSNRFRAGRFQTKSNFRLVNEIEHFIADSDNQKEVSPSLEIVIEHSFEDFGFDERVLANVFQAGYENPTPIQDKVIPLAQKNQDVIGQAQTGTGKTAAFLLPLISKLLNQQLNRVLIMAPTRELALQIEADLRVLAKGSGLVGVMCIGGTSVRGQMAVLKQEYNFLIGTPGRIKDMSQQRMIDWKRFDALVLDEVDRMLDMGFIRDVREILSELPTERQSLFFSATLPNEVESLCRTFSKNLVKVKVASVKKMNQIKQELIKLEPGQQKKDLLYDLLCKQKEFRKVIVFGRTKHGVKRLAEELARLGFASDSIHGNKSQAARQRSLALFKSDRISVLVATDVAARGIDVADVTHVINYDLPETFEDYIHRIGRTGRAENYGTAVTFVEKANYQN